jgi:zinc transporter ZupT
LIFAPYLITLIAILSAACGVWLTSLHSLSRRLVPFAGGVLIGVALFWVVPEMAAFLRWPVAFAWITGGFALLAVIDRFVYPVCPACSPAHEHDHCSTTLHGFAPPLLVASALHSALDGWSIMAASKAAELGASFVLAIAIHKVAEGLALGVIVRAALESRKAALGWCAVAQGATLAGAAIEIVLAPYLGQNALHALLAFAGGSFLYLGGHAVHGEFRRNGIGSTFVPALTGVAGPSVLRLFRFLA